MAKINICDKIVYTGWPTTGSNAFIV